MVSAAEQSLGLSGRPNYITQDYAGREGGEYLSAPWCDMGITYWARESGEFDAVCPDGGEDYAYTVAHAAAFRDAGQWTYGVSGIQAGDVVFFDWDGGSSISGIDHVGLVTGTSGDYVLTIEANTSDSCARRVRSAGTIVGYGRPPYSSDSASTASGPAWMGEYLRVQSPMLHDDTVRAWQQRMRDRGWSITVDGWYGPSSTSICRQFQAEKGLTQDGIVGPATWAAAMRTDNVTR
ncbi:peptidoglycan-binding protein [Saccharothrix sp. ST-888]|uniref:peptidoglycan-binding protein n=1 Tax=Saccharothrix sp. ST-888 TaxID=1427391 RepID=UPI0018CD8C91|nr:peptidoglycan-binding protein [Saccharothrix sp. ST-888]